MDISDFAAYAGVFALSVVGVAFFTGFESAFAAMNKVKLRHRVAQHVHGADFLEHLYRNRENFLGFTLVGMTLAFVTGIIIAVDLLMQSPFAWLPAAYAPLFAVVFSVPVMLIFGELIPRTLARRYADRAVFLFVRPVMLTYAFFYVPLVIFTSAITRALMWFLGSEKSGLDLRSSKEELRLLVRLGEKEGIVEKVEGEMIEGIFDFQGKNVAQCLTPRVNIQALPKSATLREVASLMSETGYSRIPLYENDLDHIVGIVHSFDVLTTDEVAVDECAQSLLQTISAVPEGKLLSDMLREFKSTHSHMAVVIDEHGSTAGIVTLEDILEEIVGEIRDEYDEGEPSIQMVSSSVYLVDAGVSKVEFERRFDVSLPPGGYDTFGGFVLQLWRRIPEQGEEKRFGGLSISVVKADAQRVLQARVIQLPAAASEEKAYKS